ncbi:MAG: phenylalanine--tRNA ligase subunit beta [Alphaproteobacteria bacterium]
MKFTLSWLERHLEGRASLDDIVDRLTGLGLEVEKVIDRGDELAPFTVAYVVEAVPHPNADKLILCTVDTGRRRAQVVCGAPNARTGMKGVFAAPGAVIPGTGLKLKRAEIRGVMSEGMLCSELEMGLGEDHTGIIELPDDAPVGEPFARTLGLDDPVFDLALTADRGDCLGVRGIARDLAAAGLGTLKPLDIPSVPGRFRSPIAVHLEFQSEMANACPLFIGCYLRGVNNGPSPRWLQDKLRAVGLRPISALVDITNWLTLDLGRPAHVFDADKIRGDLHVRLGEAGESLLALDGKHYAVDGRMTTIHDDEALLSLGGVIGGESTGCAEGTVNVFLEIALFDPRRTAATGRKLGIESDARYRFERGVDPAFAMPGAALASALILDVCGGEASELFVAGEIPSWDRTLRFRPSRVRTLGGLGVDGPTCRRILERLGCEVSGEGDSLAVAVPSWRGDLEVEADLVEEVLRVQGFDRIRAVSMPRECAVSRPVLTLTQRRAGWARRALAGRGMVEAVTWSFTAQAHARLFGGGRKELRLANPISAELDAMRPSVLPSLIVAAGRNADRGMADAALFEVGPAFADDTPEGQALVAGGIRKGLSGPRHWLAAPRAVDAFDAKADAVAVLVACGVQAGRLRTSADAPGWYHPGRSGQLKVGSEVLATFGEIHPATLQAMGVKGPVAGFEVFIDRLPSPRAKPKRAKPPLELSPLQPVERDFAMVVDRSVAAEDVVRAARAADKALIAEVSVFDLFEGPGVEEGKKSLAISVRLQPFERTLTDAEIEAVSAKIVAAVETAVGATLRA